MNWIKEIQAQVKRTKLKGLPAEGSATASQIEWFQKWIIENNPEWILEIGFNAGISAEGMLRTNDSCKLISFDLNKYEYTAPRYRQLKKTYGERFYFIQGDSKETVPIHARKSYDLIFIDGDHSAAGCYADIVNCFWKANPVKTTVVIDNYDDRIRYGRQVIAATKRAIAEGYLNEGRVIEGQGLDSHHRWYVTTYTNDNRLKNHIQRDEKATFTEICRRIKSEEHFSFARYGDGEFNAILGTIGANCDGHEYFPGMAVRLMEIFASNPEYEVGLHLSGVLERKTMELLHEHGLTKRKYWSNSVFHVAQRDGRLDPFFKAVGRKKTLIVGPPHIENRKILEHAKTLIVPPMNVWLDYDMIRAELDELVLSGYITLFCTGMTAPIFIDELFREYGNKATLIDFGSTLDPYCGVVSRSWQRKKLKYVKKKKKITEEKEARN